MNDKERIPQLEEVHMFIAIRRKKENRDEREICFREIIRDEVGSYLALKARLSQFNGTWRIYRTINPRDTRIAQRMLLKKLIDFPEQYCYRIDSLWKSILMQKECKIGRNVLIDIDYPDYPEEEYHKLVEACELDVVNAVPSPNGYHIVARKPDTRLVGSYADYVEIRRDGYVFVERLHISQQNGGKD